MSTPTTFEGARDAWKGAAEASAQARARYVAVYACALLASEQKTEAARKAWADREALSARLELDLAEVWERALFHTMIHLRSAPSREEAA